MKIILTGATGMVGEGVLLECLAHPVVTEILSVSRKPAGINHPKLREFIVPDFLTIPMEEPQLKGYDACFFCAGVSSVGMKAEEYRRITYDTTLHFARVLEPNPRLSFVYVSGVGTDSREKSRMAWARVKGRTENDLMKLPFRQAFGFRIGFLVPSPGQTRVLPYYRYVTWMTPILRFLAPNSISTMKQVATAMVLVSRDGYKNNVIHVKDIRTLTGTR